MISGKRHEGRFLYSLFHYRPEKMHTFDFWKKILFSGWVAGAYNPQTSLKQIIYGEFLIICIP